MQYRKTPFGSSLYIFPFSCHTLIKNITKFSSYIRKFRRDRVQSRIWPTASPYITKLRISSDIRNPLLIYDYAPTCNPFWISLYMRKKIFFFFISVFLLTPPLILKSRHHFCSPLVIFHPLKFLTIGLKSNSYISYFLISIVLSWPIPNPPSFFALIWKNILWHLGSESVHFNLLC